MLCREQEKPDGNFPTVAYPNPESPKAFELALALAKKVDADIVLATDRMPTVLASIVRIPKAVSMFPLPEICQVC